MPTIEISLYGIEFEWDSDKELLVLSEHNISFAEACSVFTDDNEVTFMDNRFDDGEQRYITIGMSNQARLLTIGWTQRANKYRLITAIKAEKKHEKYYNR